MSTFLPAALATLALLLGLTALFFFVFTRGALLLRSLSPQRHAASHVYPMYSDRWLIRLVDRQPLISAILLFQYPHLVSCIVRHLQQRRLSGGRLLITSCAFGNVIPRVVGAAVQAGAAEVLVCDLVDNELHNAQAKLGAYPEQVRYFPDDATALALPDASVDANVLFFLLHELPHPLKARALHEAARVLKVGGTLYIGEFHRPRSAWLRALGWLYFTVFEPYGLALWEREDPVRHLQALGRWEVQRSTFLRGNYQMIVATKLA